MTRPRVLVVEDNEKTADSLRIYLESGGFAVARARDGHSALAAFPEREEAREPGPSGQSEKSPDLVLLDVMLPGLDGFEVCRRLRMRTRVPVILLTARATEGDKLNGLALGADDYVTKPFSPREVVLRVKAVLRRVAAGASEGTPERAGRPVTTIGRLVIDPERQVVELDGRPLELARAERRVLDALARRAGRVCSRAALAQSAFGPDWDGGERAIDAHVARLRKELAKHPGCGVAIVTVFGVGYRIEARRAP